VFLRVQRRRSAGRVQQQLTVTTVPGELFEAVERLVTIFSHLPDSMMDREWTFKDYDGEGLRFALLQTGLELREWAALAHQARVMAGQPMTPAQRIMAQYHVAYRDLDGVWCGLTDAEFDHAPAEKEWAIRRTSRHMIGTELFFLTVTRYALERHRSGDGRPENLSEDQWASLVEPLATRHGIELAKDVTGSFAEVKTRFDGLHSYVLSEASRIGDDELEWPSYWWESYPQSIRFRLLRFEAHLRQHTIQVEKIRVTLGYTLTEAHRLIRQVYNALGDAEAATIGAPNVNATSERQLAGQLQARAVEIAHLIN